MVRPMHESAGTESQSDTTSGRRPFVSARGGRSSSGEAVYGLGMVGALVYFLGTAATGRDRILGVGKAIVWPALLVNRAFRTLGG